jgi:alpha-D-xyloside xylohydrolase
MAVETSAPAHWAEVLPGVWKARIGVPEKHTPVSGRNIAPQIEAFGRLPRVSTSPLSPLLGSVTPRGCLLQIPLQPHELVYGLGLQLLSFAQRGKKKVVRVNADPKVDTGDSHAPVPFYVTTDGVGILVDTARYATFYFGDARPKPEQAISSVSSANPDPAYTHNLEDAAAAQVTIEVPRTRGVDVYLFAGPTMLDAVRRYNVFSGGGHLPPEWGLGFWYRCDARSTEDSALALARSFRERKIPCDVLGLEPGWQTHAYSCTFVWEKERFPDPARFLAQARQSNYKVNLWEHAFTHPASPLFPPLQKKSADYGVWGGLVPDFADPAARQIFGNYHGTQLIDLGVSGFKLDECDNSDFTGGWSFPETSRFPSGLDGEQMHNLFGLQYQKTIWDQFLSRKQATYNLVRSSGALAAPYPFVLYSDLYGHRDFIRALVNSGFSGLSWCPEVRDAVSVEDLLRRLQSVVFSPLAMVNGWYIKSPPWHQLNRELNNSGQQMEDWEDVEAQCREIIGWRMSLVPYLLSAFHRYRADGTPPFRATILDYPRDPTLQKVDDQYMVGDRMMVAPMFAGEPSRSVVIPSGESWHDFWTGKAIPGGSVLKVDASHDKIPVFVKSGSIVPWADVGLHAEAPEGKRISARLYGNASRTFTMGDSPDTLHLDGNHSRSTIHSARYTVYEWKQIG